MSLRPASAGDRRAELRIGRQRRVIDLVHHFQKFVRIEPVLFHQSAQARAVAAIIILLHAKCFVGRDLQEVGDVIADALIDLMPEIEVMRIKRVVEIEHPGFDRAEAAHRRLLRRPGHLGATRCCHSLFAGVCIGRESVMRAGRSWQATVYWQPERRDRINARVLRKTIPFVQAVLIGTLAAAVVVGFAIYVAHS